MSKKVLSNKQTYKYIRNDSIVNIVKDEYTLSETEYCRIHLFYLTYSICKRQSAKKRAFMDYGWESNNISSPDLGKALSNVLEIKGNTSFCFSEENNLKIKFKELDLEDRMKGKYDYERFVIGTTLEDNNYLRLFHRIRNGLAHGRYSLVYSTDQTRMVVIQDNDNYNVTARIVLKLETILKFIDAIDRNGKLLTISQDSTHSLNSRK